MKHAPDLGRQDGFTTLELLVATTLFSVLLVGVVSVYANNITSYVTGQHRIELQQNGRIAVARLLRELQFAGFDLSERSSSRRHPRRCRARSRAA